MNSFPVFLNIDENRILTKQAIFIPKNSISFVLTVAMSARFLIFADRPCFPCISTAKQ